MRDPDLLSPAEVGELLGISRPTVYRWAAQDLIPGAMKKGGKWVFSYPRLMNGLHGIPLPTEARPAAELATTEKDAAGAGPDTGSSAA